MKKFALIIIAVMLVFACLAFTACNNNDIELVANDAEDLLQEDFGIAVTKGDTDILAAVNAVIDEWMSNGNMDKYMAYYSELAEEGSNPVAPEGLKLEWNLSGYTDVLNLYTETGFAPYEFISSKGYPVTNEYSVAGIDIAIACQVAENLGCKLVIHDILFDNVVESVKNPKDGKGIGAAGITITAERQESVDFSHIYSSSTISIVCNAEAQYTKLADLDGLKIGVQEGTSGDLIASAAKTANGYKYATDFDDDGNEIAWSTPIKLSGKTKIIQMKSYSALMQALKNGQIDVIVMDKAPALLLIKNA